MEKTLRELIQEQATEKDLIYEFHKEENLQKLYEYATIVMELIGKNPYGEVKSIIIEDNFGTHIRININNNKNQ